MLDEAMCLSSGEFIIMLPLLMKIGSFMCIASSLPHGPHWSTDILREKPDYVYEVRYELVCDACSKLDIVDQFNCTHVQQRGNPMLSRSKRDKLMKLNVPREEMLIENYGKEAQDNNLCYTKEIVESFFDPKNVYQGKVFESYCVYIDTNTAGSCDTALVICGYKSGKYSILWYSSYNTKHLETELAPFIFDNLMEFSVQFRGNDTHIPIFVAIESQNNWNGSFFHLLYKNNYINQPDLKKLIFIYEGSNGGVWMTAGRAQQMFTLVNNYMRNKKIFMHEAASTCNKYGNKNDQRFKLRRQVEGYKHTPSDSKTGKRKYSAFSGKDSGNDDYMPCLHGCVYTHFMVHNDAKYAKHLKEAY